MIPRKPTQFDLLLAALLKGAEAREKWLSNLPLRGASVENERRIRVGIVNDQCQILRGAMARLAAQAEPRE